MTSLKSEENSDVNFEEYKKWVDKFTQNNDTREINYQNDVIKPFLEILFKELDIVDVSTKGPKSRNHDYLQYCGTYIDKNGKEKASAPDLVAAQNWNWHNLKYKVDYRAVIEVKSPYANERIYDKDGYSCYCNSLKNKIEQHLNAKQNDKLILTDCLKWEFYQKSSKLTPQETFCLGYKKNNKIMWKDENEFNKLKNHLKKFLEACL